MTARLRRSVGDFRDDVVLAVRQLRASPVFTSMAAATLALGIGANSAMFALADAALLRPLPFPEPDRLVMVWERSDTAPRGLVSPPNLADWQERTRAFDGLAGFNTGVGGMVMAGADGTAETVSRQWVGAGFFHVLGVRALIGRTLEPADEHRGENLVVMSEGFWRSRFAGDPDVVGRPLTLDGEPFTLVGVVPASFQWQTHANLWALRPLDRRPAMRGARFLGVVGRVKGGVTLEAAEADLGAVAGALSQEYPRTNAGRGVALAPLRDALVGGDLRLTSWLLLGVMGFVLLLCCANVANLLLVRTTARAKELAVRSALGAGRGRLVRHVLTESLVVAALGGALGVAVGAALLAAAPSMLPEGLLPAAVTLTFDWRVLSFCAGASLVVGLLFGLAPAWHIGDLSAARVIAADSRTATPRRRLAGGLVVAQVAAAVVLLTGAGLLVRTLIAVETIDRGYRADALTMMVDPLGSRYPTRGSLQQFFDEVSAEVNAVPGVGGLAWSSGLPLAPLDTLPHFAVEGDPVVEPGLRPSAQYQIVSGSYFETLGVPLVEGRAFSDWDHADSVPVCIVNEAIARRFFGGRSAIGRRLVLRTSSSADAQVFVREIVGVARQVKGRPDEAEEILQIYVPMPQHLLDDMYLIVRPAAGDAAALAPGVRAAIARIDRAQLVSVRDAVTLYDVAWDATGGHRFRAGIASTFAGLALTLAMIGVFGILAAAVQARVREIAVRRALGATSAGVLRLVAGSALRVVLGGAIVGAMVAAGLTRLLTGMLFGVPPLDPWTFVLVGCAMLLGAAAATAAPAWAAARVDPAEALRAQ